MDEFLLLLGTSVGSDPQAGWGRKRCSCERVGSRLQNWLCYCKFIPVLTKTIVCVVCAHTCLRRGKGLESKDTKTWFEFHRSREEGLEGWLGNSAAGLLGTLPPGKPSVEIRRGTIEDLLLKINFPREWKECSGSETKDMHLNHECHS